MPETVANRFDTERDLIVPQSVAQSNQVPTTPWRVIEEASNQLSAGQPVTALPKQSWSVAESQYFAARLNQFDQQSKAAKQAAQQAAIDARMLDQMSRVAKSTKDIEIARRSIDVMALQRDIQNGVPIHQAIARHPMALGGGFGTALRATTPASSPSKLEIAGMPPAVMAGGRPYWPPASAMPAEPMPTTGQTIRDEQGRVIGTGVTTGPRSRTVIREPSVSVRPGSLTAVESAILRGIDKEADEKRKAMERLKPTSKEFLELGNELAGITRRRNKILADAEGRGTSPIAAQSSASTERIRVRKDGKEFTVPKAQRQQAIDEGYTPVE